jgi:hypothetical protein
LALRQIWAPIDTLLPECLDDWVDESNPVRAVATEMALPVFAYNLTGVMNIVGIKPRLAAIRA